MPRVIVFDVNKTLLDLRVLAPHFQRIFGDATVMQQWFAQVLHSSLIATVTGVYFDFGTIGDAALDMTAARQGVVLSADDQAKILDGMQTLPPQPDVRDSLERLHDAGLRLATLANSIAQVVKAQLTNAGFDHYFEALLSVDDVRRFKPAAETYRMAARRLGVEVGQIRLVAAHDWDIAGALQAGCVGAFVARPGMIYNPLLEKPDVIGSDLRAVTDQILEIEL